MKASINSDYSPAEEASSISYPSKLYCFDVQNVFSVKRSIRVRLYVTQFFPKEFCAGKFCATCGNLNSQLSSDEGSFHLKHKQVKDFRRIFT
jgi:hypothetical protein